MIFKVLILKVAFFGAYFVFPKFCHCKWSQIASRITVLMQIDCISLLFENFTVDFSGDFCCCVCSI